MSINQLVARQVEIRRITACLPGLEEALASAKVNVASPEAIGYKAIIANLQLRDAEKALATAMAGLESAPGQNSSSIMRFAGFQADYILACEDIDMKLAELEIGLAQEKETASKGAWKFSSGVAKENSAIKALKTQIEFFNNEKAILDARNVTTEEVLTEIRLMESQQAALLDWIYDKSPKPDFVEEDEAADLTALHDGCERLRIFMERPPPEERLPVRSAADEWGTPITVEESIRSLKAEMTPEVELAPEFHSSTNGRGSKAWRDMLARFTAAAKARRLASVSASASVSF